ncbi:STAS/SEC14 domain-containing protein [Coraliomargarita parva]|uniref:STAS/SEC14 domain-containing protein n=1 Tax=Coraliomargarita parva TaxID=3014050 RepID=UPI0022B583DA|nr:STAS/SEC14 domain-containing protein [Coraliomargarita parva]
MTAILKDSQDDYILVHVSGWITKTELDAINQQVAKIMETETAIRMLIHLVDFKGWVKGDDWGDTTHLAAFGNRIPKMAIVGKEQWKEDSLLFMGAGYRSTEIQYFIPENESSALLWLLE